MAVIAVIVVGFATGIVKLANLSQVTTGVIIVASVAYFVVMLTSSKVAAVERTRVRAFVSTEPVWIILLSPLFAIVWTRRRPHRENSRTA